MALSDLTAASVKAAAAEFDRLGREAFLKAHRFGETRTHFLELDGKLYDSRAIAGVAHGYIGPGFTHLKSSHFTGGEATAKQVLENLGFKVVKLGGGDGPIETVHPDWTRDELILALDEYVVRGDRRDIQRGEARIEALSDLLRQLNSRLGRAIADSSRSVNSVYMTLGQFVRLDPENHSQGIPNPSKLQREVWETLADKPVDLAHLAAVIRAFAEGEGETPPDYDADEIAEAPEGRVFTRLHRYRERNRALVDQRKRGALRATGKLACEACGFEFAETYGVRGHGYIEAHHTKPVSTLAENAKTRLEDLALLCANCHRMIHAAQPWLELRELKALLAT